MPCKKILLLGLTSMRGTVGKIIVSQLMYQEVTKGKCVCVCVYAHAPTFEDVGGPVSFLYLFKLYIRSSSSLSEHILCSSLSHVALDLCDTFSFQGPNFQTANAPIFAFFYYILQNEKCQLSL